MCSNTNLIRVSMSSKSSIESATIVNAVVDAYLKNATTTNFEYTDRRIKRLKEDQATRLEDVKRKRNEIHRLREKLGAAGHRRTEGSQRELTLDQHRRYTDRLTDVEIRRMAAQVRLDRLQNEKIFPGQMQTPTHIDARVRDAFYAFQEVAELQRQLERIPGITPSRPHGGPAFPATRHGCVIRTTSTSTNTSATSFGCG